MLLAGTLGSIIGQIWDKIQWFLFNDMHIKMMFAKWRPFCLGLSVLIYFKRPSFEQYDPFLVGAVENINSTFYSGYMVDVFDIIADKLDVK